MEGYDVYRAADREGQYALLFPNYSGAAMLMVQKGILYAPDAPTPTPAPTPQPTATPRGHWESVTVEVDCPACVSGVCPHCHGTGVFRLYGVATTCEKKCAQCDGFGTYTTSRMIFVYD